MDSIRRRLAWLACVWLSCQFATMTATSLSLCASLFRPASDVVCTCLHDGPDAHCPMHHHSTSTQDCRYRSNALDPSTAAIATLLGRPTVLTPMRGAAVRPSLWWLVRNSSPLVVNRVSAPEGPPPRA